MHCRMMGRIRQQINVMLRQARQRHLKNQRTVIGRPLGFHNAQRQTTSHTRQYSVGIGTLQQDPVTDPGGFQDRQR